MTIYVQENFCNCIKLIYNKTHFVTFVCRLPKILIMDKRLRKTQKICNRRSVSGRKTKTRRTFKMLTLLCDYCLDVIRGIYSSNVNGNRSVPNIKDHHQSEELIQLFPKPGCSIREIKYSESVVNIREPIDEPCKYD